MTITFEQASATFNNYVNHVELNALIYDTVRTHGMSRGFMHFLNKDGQLTKLFKLYSINVDVPAVEAFNMIDTIDTDSESLVMAFESLLETAIQKVKDMWKFIVTLVKKIWHTLFNKQKLIDVKVEKVKQIAIGTDIPDENKQKTASVYDNDAINKMTICIIDLLKLVDTLTNIISRGGDDCGKNESEAKQLTSHLKEAFNIDVRIATKNETDGYVIDVDSSKPMHPATTVTAEYVLKHRFDNNKHSSMSQLISKFYDDISDNTLDPVVLRSKAKLNEDNPIELKKITRILNSARNIQILHGTINKCVSIYLNGVSDRLDFEIEIYKEAHAND